jgi:hypothetical protein
VELTRRLEAESGMRWLLKRWWFWAGTPFMLVAVCVGYLVIPVGEGRISQATCDKLQLGMTHEEVKSLLGNRCLGVAVSIEPPCAVTWFVDKDDEFPDGNVIIVTFKLGWDDTVTRKEFRPAKVPFHVLLKRRIERRIRTLWPHDRVPTNSL